MKQTSSEITKNVFVKSVLNSIMTSILQDPEMTSEFVVEPSEDTQEQQQQKPIVKPIEEEPIIQKQFVQKQEAKCNRSRLQIQIEKNRFNMNAISGEVFFLLVQAFLQGKKSEQQGKLMLTNYRVLFFKDQTKRVDLPFGRIGKVEYFQKQTRIVYHLKYPHIWRFRVVSANKFMQFKNVGDIYYKTDSLRKTFAFEYALKIMPIPQPYHFSITDEYKRLRFDKNHPNIDFVGQQNYHLCPTYPSTFYTAVSQEFDLNTISSHRKNRRLPILAYKYFPNNSKQQVPLWLSSSYEQLKSYNKAAEKNLLNLLKCDLKLQIFVAEAKNAKVTDENYFDKGVSVTYLKLQGNNQLSLAEKHLFQVFLANKKPFIKQIINSKWYTYISNILDACHTLRNNFLQENSILIRCESGFDKSLLLASLLQIIMDPYFRTFKGFQALVMRMFVHYGHPFTDRLGLLSSNSGISPIFLQFLDCVSQLINQNPQHFQFNFKYLAKISSLMQLNIYGTFLANSSKQYKENRIEAQTCSIWGDIISPITTNGFYNKRGGILEVDSGLSAMRIWKQHFGDMISRNKDHYRFEEIAEDNDDYLNLYCLRLKDQNQELMARMKQKMSELQKLQRQLRQRQGSK